MAEVDQTVDKNMSYNDLVAGGKDAIDFDSRNPDKSLNKQKSDTSIIARFVANDMSKYDQDNSRLSNPSPGKKRSSKQVTPIPIEQKIKKRYRNDAPETVNTTFFRRTSQPLEINCHYCKKQVTTKTQYRCN